MSKKEKINKQEKLTLDKTHPDLCRQWHPTMNILKPSDVTAGSGFKAWWYLPYKDPETGKFHVFEWQAAVYHRVNGVGCPVLSNKMVWPGYNDLSTQNSRLVNEWDYKKNSPLRPRDVTIKSTKKVYWKCEKGHSWASSVVKRHVYGQGCPVCAKELQTSFPEQVTYYYIKSAFEDARWGDKETIGMELDIYIPSIKVAIEYDGRRWHDNVELDVKKIRYAKTMELTSYEFEKLGALS